MAFKDAPQCTGTSKRSGKRCKKPAMRGRDKCDIHGGKTPRGIDSPNFKHGGRSKYLPTRMMAIYDDLENDSDYNDLRNNIKLREMFLREKLAMLDESPDSATTWAKFRKTLDDFKKAWANDNLGAANLALETLDVIVDERMVYFETQKEIRADLAEQRKDHQAIANIEYKGENAATMTELLTFVGAVLNLVTAHVSDKKTKSAIFNGIDNLVSNETSDTLTIKRLEG